MTGAAERAAPFRLGPPEVLLATAGLLATLAVSAMLLMHWGFSYGSAGGSAIEKLHPGTLLIGAAFGVACLRGGLGNAADHLLRHHRGIVVALLLVAAYTADLVFVLRRPFTFVVDTLVAPCLALVLLRAFSEEALTRLARAIHLVMAGNALIAVAEVLIEWRLTPFYLMEGPITYDWRATALLGHPLQNASITGTYLLALALGFRRALPRGFFIPALLLQLAALPAFGGRTAAVGALLVLAGLAGLAAARALAGRRVRLDQAVALAFAAPLALLASGAVAASGYLDPFLERFVSDEGSAEARIRMFRLFEPFTFGELLVGPDPETLASHQYREGLELGIESFVISYVLESGLFGAMLVFAGLALFCASLVAALPRASLVPVLYFLALSATSTGLSSKTVALTLVTLILVALGRAAPQPRVGLEPGPSQSIG